MREDADAGSPLYEMDPTGRFTDRAADYVRWRPDYPAAAIDALLAGLGDPALLRVADVGAGTGIASRQLAARGVRVLAIEPNAAMRSAAAVDGRIEWRDGTAEATGLEAGAVGLVLCAQAFHWFRHREAVAEFRRVLAPGGRLALMWNSRDRSDPLTRGYIQAIHAVGGEHPAEMRELDEGVLTRDGHFAGVRTVQFPHVQRLDAAGLLGRATSASYVPREGERLEALRERLGALHAVHRDTAGYVAMRYLTRITFATRCG